MKLLSDFAKKVAESLGITARGVDQLFDFSEDKQGFFVARLKPQQFLDRKDQFRTMCALVRDLGGEDYLPGTMAWKVPGPYAKKPQAPEGPKPVTTSTPSQEPQDARSKPSGQGMDSERAYKETGNAIPTGPSGVAQHVVTDDKSRPPQFMVPLKALLSMPFQCRTNPDDPEMAELTESIKALGVLQPILVRPKPNGLYEIVYGQRRVKAAEKAGLIEIPADIRVLSDQEAYEVQFIENIQREDLSDMEKARMLNFLITKFGYTQEALAQKVGKSKAWVSQHIAMLELEKVHPGELQTGEITERQAREILAAPEEKREEILDQINETGEIPSAREIRRAVQPEQLHEPIGPEPEVAKGPVETPKPLLTGFEVECPECHVKLLINHVDHPNGKVTHEVEG